MKPGGLKPALAEQMRLPGLKAGVSEDAAQITS